jgi:hypothetical protein
VTDSQHAQLFHARRVGAKARLTGEGMTAALAEAWLAAWEASSTMDAESHSFDFWERGRMWASTASAAGQRPPPIVG